MSRHLYSQDQTICLCLTVLPPFPFALLSGKVILVRPTPESRSAHGHCGNGHDRLPGLLHASTRRRRLPARGRRGLISAICLRNSPLLRLSASSKDHGKALRLRLCQRCLVPHHLQGLRPRLLGKPMKAAVTDLHIVKASSIAHGTDLHLRSSSFFSESFCSQTVSAKRSPSLNQGSSAREIRSTTMTARRLRIRCRGRTHR